MSNRFHFLLFPALASALVLSLGAPRIMAANLSGAAQSVMPQDTRQVISINYQRLASDRVAQQLEAQVLPPQMKGLNELLEKGGIQPEQDLNRLSFATYQGKKGVGLIGIAEGNLGSLNLNKFFTPTKTNPNPPQISGVNVYSSGGLTFFVPDPSIVVFGSRDAVAEAIQTQQGGASMAQNEQMSDLVAGTQTSDVWSVLDAAGARTMVQSMIGSSLGPISPGMIDKRFNGARYTIQFENQVQVNLELMTTDALSAAAVSTGLNAAIAMRAKQEQNPAAKALLNEVQVDSAGNHAFLQVSAPESNVAALTQTDLLQAILKR